MEVTNLPTKSEEITEEAEKKFAGGKQVRLSVSPPRKLYDLQLEIAGALSELNPDVADPKAEFRLKPPPRPDTKTRKDWENEKLHGEFFLISMQDLDVGKLVDQISGTPLFDQYGGTPAAMARDAQVWAITAVILSWFGIIAYVWFRFGSWTFGVGGVIALVHDVLVALSLLALVSILAVNFPAVNAIQLTEMRIDLNVIAALMTLIGYSINDTIVIFDRVRELRGKSPRVTADIVDRALNGTLSRTIITALTVFVTVFVLFLFGGEGIHAFAFVLVVGTISGTYSTIYIACPVMLWLEEWRTKGMKRPTMAESPLATTIR
jgi:SecD/SecF fusion protein